MSIMRAIGTVVVIYGAYKLGKAVGGVQAEMKQQQQKQVNNQQQ